MIMQVLSQGPSLLLAVWTGLALLEGGESVCSYSCATATTESHNVRQGDSSVFSCEGTYISWCYTSYTPTQTITTTSNNQGIRKSWLVYSNIRSSMTLQCDSSSSCIKKISVNVIVPLSSVSISGSSKIGYRTALRLTCSISGTRGTYNWYLNGSLITSTTYGSYYKSSAQLSDSGRYQCRACNWAGCRFSYNSQTVRVAAPPYSVRISGSSRITYTSRLSLTCYASGIVESYRWYRNASYIPTSTTNSYVISSAQLSDNGRYYCRPCNWAGCTSSSTRTVRVTAPPYSVSIGGSSSIGSTTTLSLTCSASGMVERYLWYHNGSYMHTKYSTGTTNSYVKYSAQLSDSGVYYCKACNWAYCTSSSTRTIKLTAPSSASISGSTTVGYTQTLRLTCSVSGIANNYQWYYNYYTSLSSTSSYYSKSAQQSDTGSYQCRACNWAGCTSRSSSHTVTVTAVPPSSARIRGSSQVRYTSTLSLTCSASGIVDNYKWYRNSSLLTTTTRDYYKSPAQLSDSGYYQCVACNWAGCTSSSRTVTVREPPYSVRISGLSKLLTSASLRLTCYASGTVERYEWYHSGSRLPSTVSYYRKSSAQLSDSGSYQCKACNFAGCSTRSSSYTVTVIDVPDAVDVSSIEVTNTTLDTISIQWTPPNNNFDSIIDYRVVLYGSGGRVGVFTSSQPMLILVFLQPFTTYQIRISARNNAGWGGNSSERNVNTLTRDEVIASNLTYSTPRGGVFSYTVELRWEVPKGLLTDKLEGYRLSRWPTNTTDIETTTVNRDNVSCAWNVTAIGSETYCHEWKGFSPGRQYTVSLEIVYNYGILSTGDPTNVTMTIPTLPPSQEEVGTVGLAVGVAVGVLLAVLVTAVFLIVVLLICRKCRRSKMKDTDTAAVYNVSKDVNDNPLETVQFEPAYGGDDYTLTDDPRYVTEDLKMSRDPHCASKDRVTSQEQHYASLDLKSVQSSAYASLTFNQNSSTAISKYGDNTNDTSEYETPEKVVPQKKPSTQQSHEYANWNFNSQQHGEGDQSSVDRKSSNKIASTSGPGVKEVRKETTAPQKSQVFTSDVTLPSKKEDISDTHHLTLQKKHEQREKVPPPTKQRPDINNKQSTLHPPTQESATSKPQARPQQPIPVTTGSPSNASPKPPITSKVKKQPLLPKKVPPEKSAVAKQPPPGQMLQK